MTAVAALRRAAYTARRYERGRLVIETSVQLGEWVVNPPEDRIAVVELTHPAVVALEEPF